MELSSHNRIRECVSLSSLKTIPAKIDCLQFSSIGTDPCSQNKGSISFQFSIKITITITFCSILFFFQMQMNPGSEIKRLRLHQFSISPSFGARYQCKHFGSSSFQTCVIPTLVSFFTLSDLPFLMLHILKRNSFKKKKISRSSLDPENSLCGNQQLYNFLSVFLDIQILPDISGKPKLVHPKQKNQL